MSDQSEVPDDEQGTIAPAAEALPGKADSAGWRRMHPLTPLMQGGLALLVILGIIIANLREMLIELFVGESYSGGGPEELIETVIAEGMLGIGIAAIFGLILVIVLFSWLSWRVHTYRITGEAVENRSGILFKKHRRAPLDRIQSVNLQRPLLARMLGLTKIDVQTGGAGGKVELAYLGHRDAKTVREQIVRSAARSQGDDPSESAPEPVHDAAAVPTGDPVGAVGYDGTSYGEAHGAFDRRVQEFADFDIDASARRSGVLVAVPVPRLIGSILLSWEMLFTVAVLIAIVVIAIVRSPGALVGLIPLALVMVGLIFGQFNKGFNFTLTRSREGIRTSAGLTATNTETIPLGRVHSVEAMQPLGWRIFGWWKVRINVAGYSVSQGGQNSNRNIVLPVGRVEDAVRVLEALLPDAFDEQHPLRDALVGSGEGYVRPGTRSASVLWFARRRAGVQLVAQSRNDERATLRIRRGALTRSLIVAPLLRTQSVQLRRPLVHRMLGLASIQTHTVLGPIGVEARGLALPTARAFFDELAGTVVRVQSGEADRREAERLAEASAPDAGTEQR
ncbi:PH domain-containing protein [Leucobacter tardus]|uniref:PH domain-containing protein n=1 Tax=Leucobacter tardus TaxID=501483 RepID=A0A939QF46_9MICO|nr:PH domain-containing protein [Leucobacter tardus]MBO2990980.1 PH domain-containing protein [Leucobacter tardus]